MSGLGIIDRAVGFIFGGAKIFFIFSVVAYLAVQVNAFKNILNKKDMIKNSMTFPILVETGSIIFKLDTSKFLSSDTNADETLETQEIKKTINKEESQKETLKEELNNGLQKLNQEAQDTASVIKQKASELIEETVAEVIVEKLTPTENK